MTDTTPAPITNAQLFARFLRFGLLAWGGPVAQIAMIRRELVDEERWISSARFNRLLSVFQVLPGPEAHELCVHLGFLRGGRLGGLLAGLGFMFPGFLLMLALSWLYFQLDFRNPGLQAAFLGAQIAVVALVVLAVQRIGSHILTNPVLWVVGALAALATAAGTNFILVLICAGVVGAVASRQGYRLSAALVAVTVLAATAATAGVVLWSIGHPPTVSPSIPPVPAAAPSAVDLFTSGLRAGLLTFGGAYTAIPFIRSDAVGRGWLTDGQFVDGLALSGVLPAPFIIFSTFVGYVAGGAAGALAITIGVFLPAFAFSLVLGNRIEAAVDNEAIHTFLDGVAAGVVGIILVTALQIAEGVVRTVPSLLPALLIFGVALATLVVVKLRTAVVWVVAGAAICGSIAFA